MKLEIKVIPNAKKTELVSYKDGAMRLRIQSPPVDGKANEAVIKFLARFLKIRKNQIKLVRGDKNRLKIFEIPDGCLVGSDY